MPALPPETTQRYWLEYNDGIYTHELMLRGRVDTTIGDFETIYTDLFTALDAVLFTGNVTGARFSEAGETFSNPVTPPAIGSYGTGTMSGASAPRELAWEGRSSDSKLVSYSIYGWAGATPDVYRFQPEANVALNNARLVLDAAHAAGYLCTISGLRAIIKPYTNFNFNSYWERQRRG